MAKRTKEQYVSQMLKTSEYWKTKADREYAYYKNADNSTDAQKHYLASQSAYKKAEEYKKRAEDAGRQ